MQLSPIRCHQKSFLKAKNKNPDNIMAMGNVSTHASNKFRTVLHCKPE